MKIINQSLLAFLTVCALAPNIAQAQSGSRLCGHVSVDGPVKVGLLYEARQKDASYNKQCDEAIKETMDKIESNPQLKAMHWEKVKKATCEDIGNRGFVNKGQSPDMCDNMEAKQAYKVMKQGEANATYEKQ